MQQVQKRKARPLSAATKATLARKAKNSRFTLGQLTRVYRRGAGFFHQVPEPA